MRIKEHGKHPHNDMLPLGHALVAPPKDDGVIALRRGRVRLSNFS